MSLRQSHLSRLFSQASRILQNAPPASTTTRTSSLPSSPLLSRAFGMPSRRALSFQTRGPSQIIFRSGQMQQPGNIFRRSFFRSARSNSSAQSEQQAPSLSQRLRTLSKEYGWSALWVYLILSAVDFPLCFMAVRLAGVERIGHYEHVISESVKGAVRKVWPPSEEEEKAAAALQRQAEQEEKEAGEEKANGGEASLWTQLALAYAVHKSLIFIRVPLTAAITPNVVKVLRGWGWDIVKGRPKGM
ncbi:uncharacterized protein BO88DRAFT_401590 [Aspergillus vadensis CBS 113365]|uniref:DUF1279 domain-containing protein n=1 Tax=Aspergillus vadensis (strain CBS 113365 / IMI 142717 / IBT 24658) TaxID=1448311 RepID=A0A319C6I6_ASPVC|nr:hypothetical protein BO88DRAFT_401590 [Aspergillus vadensis CBS 113365]PYH74013.1 hypothetical protein BO88DRAFT_401590 [Aspergillus vadensis CBS 113365]